VFNVAGILMLIDLRRNGKVEGYATRWEDSMYFNNLIENNSI